MRGSYNIIIYEPAEIIYVLTPKCGSTTMMRAFMTLAGINTKGESIRKEKKMASAEGKLISKGLRIERCTRETVIETRKRFPAYRMFANIRNPYERLVSNYYSKLNRYAEKFSRKVYLYGKLRQLLAGPSSWGAVESGNIFMQQRLSFEEVLKGLETHGTDFDVHYARQSELLLIDQIQFDRLVRLERLASDLISAMEDCCIEPDAIDRIRSLPHSNASSYDRGQNALMTPLAREITARLYADDFEKLGYPY